MGRRFLFSLLVCLCCAGLFVFTIQETRLLIGTPMSERLTFANGVRVPFYLPDWRGTAEPGTVTPEDGIFSRRDFSLMVLLPCLSGLVFLLLGTSLSLYLSPKPGFFPLLSFHFLLASWMILISSAQVAHRLSYLFFLCFALLPPIIIHFSLIFSEGLGLIRSRVTLRMVPYLISLGMLVPYAIFFKANQSVWLNLHRAFYVYLVLAFLFWVFRLVMVQSRPSLEIDRILHRYMFWGQLSAFVIPIAALGMALWGNYSIPPNFTSPLIQLFPLALLLGMVPWQRKLKETYIVQSEKRSTFGNLLAGLAHELNNPMTFIHSNLEPMREILEGLEKKWGNADRQSQESFHELRQIVGDIEEGVRRSRALIRDFRDLPLKRTEPKVEADVNEVVDKSIDLLGHKWRDRIRVERRFEELPKIKGYPLELGQVFTNLLSNAFDATPDGGTVYVSTNPSVTGIKVCIRDTGKGIPQDQIRKIFDPLFTTKPQGEGTGLGLSIALQKIKNHGGTIEVKSEVGRGTEFLVFLPY